MTTTKNLLSLALVASFAALPALAAGNDDPGRKGELVQTSKDAWQAENGPSGWGQRVSDKANGTVDNPDKNLGGYLRRMDPNPNAGKK